METGDELGIGNDSEVGDDSEIGDDSEVGDVWGIGDDLDEVWDGELEVVDGIVGGIERGIERGIEGGIEGESEEGTAGLGSKVFATQSIAGLTCSRKGIPRIIACAPIGATKKLA